MKRAIRHVGMGAASFGKLGGKGSQALMTGHAVRRSFATAAPGNESGRGLKVPFFLAAATLAGGSAYAYVHTTSDAKQESLVPQEASPK